MDPLLGGLVVEQRGDSLASRYAGKLFADLGAEVHAPLPQAPRETRYERWLDAGKVRVSGLPADIVLTEDADDPGGPVTVLIEPFGAGPYASYASSDLVVLALSGWLSLNGLQGREPIAPALPLASVAAGASAVSAGLFALAGARTGKGNGRARVSLLDTMHRMLASWGVHYPMLGNIPGQSLRNGYRWSGVVPCADGFMVTPMARPEWDMVSTLIADEDLRDSRWRDPAYALGNCDEIIRREAAGFRGRSREELVELAAALGLPFAPVRNAREVLACPQLAARGFWRPSAGGGVEPGLPFIVAARRHGPARAPHPPLHRHGDGPLDGLLVVELTVAWSGPFCGRILADAGATVVKLESGRRPDTSRSLPVVGAELGERWWDRSLSYSVANSGKYHVGLEMDLAGGRAIAEELIRRADIVINNHAPRVLPNLGLTFDEIAKLNPNVVYLTSTGYGSEGPFRDRNSLGWSIEAMSGITAHFGYPGGEPSWAKMPFPDVYSALVNAIAAAAALEARSREPGAIWVDVAQHESGVHAALAGILETAESGREEPLRGNRHARFAPQGVYAAGDAGRWVAISVADDAQWRALAAAIGHAEVAAQFPGARERQAAHDTLDAMIADWTGRRPAREAEASLQAAGVPAAAVRNLQDVFLDPHHRAHNYDCAENRETGRWPWPARWQQFGGVRRNLRWATPRFGEHNDEVLGEWLHAGALDRERMRADGILRDTPAYAVVPSAAGLPPSRQVELGEILAHDPEHRVRAGAFCNSGDV